MTEKPKNDTMKKIADYITGNKKDLVKAAALTIAGVVVFGYVIYALLY